MGHDQENVQSNLGYFLGRSLEICRVYDDKVQANGELLLQSLMLTMLTT